MKRLNTMCASMLAVTVAGTMLSATRPADAAATILISGFDDGTRTGWTTIPTYNGTLTADSTGGNPGGFMVATDNTGGGYLFVRYYLTTFDLTNMKGIQWDEYVPDRGTATDNGTAALLIGSDDTIYRRDPLSYSVGTWVTQLVDFEPGTWSLATTSPGSATFAEVLLNAQIGFSMDTSTLGDGSRESGIDNVKLVVPEPSAVIHLVILMVLGLVGGFVRRWRIAS